MLPTGQNQPTDQPFGAAASHSPPRWHRGPGLPTKSGTLAKSSAAVLERLTDPWTGGAKDLWMGYFWLHVYSI